MSGNRSTVCGQFFMETEFWDKVLLGILLDKALPSLFQRIFFYPRL